ncbi:MAG: LptA/OstA family protein [Thermodesulfobacteriota bacterium]
MDKLKVRLGPTGRAALFLLIMVLLSGWSPGGEALAKDGKKADKLGSSGPIVITSKTMKADRTARTVVFKGDVEAREDFLLCSDELYMNYTAANEVAKIDARGHVRIFRDTGIARARSAVYNRQDHVLVLSGEAVVERCADIVKGDKITLYLDDDSALVEGSENGRVKAVIVPDKKCAGTFGEKGVEVNAKDSLCKSPR